MSVIGDMYAHFVHEPEVPDLTFTSDPEISCNIDGRTFIHYIEKDADGNVKEDFWMYEEYPRKPIVQIEAETHGFGWAHILLYGNIDGKPFGDSENTHPDRLGDWISFLPIVWGIDNTPFWEEYGSFNTAPNDYSWDGSGSIKIVPVFWESSITGIIPGGKWKNADSEFHTTKNASSAGKWTVELQEAVVPSITYNDTEFTVYETLEVTVKHSDLSYAMLSIDGILVDSKSPSNGEIVLSKKWNTGDIGEHTVEIIAYYKEEDYYGEEGEYSITESSPVIVE